MDSIKFEKMIEKWKKQCRDNKYKEYHETKGQKERKKEKERRSKSNGNDRKKND